MGCGSSKSADVKNIGDEGKPGDGDKVANTNESNGNEDEEENGDETYVTVEEATAYVEQELAIAYDRAKQMVLSVSHGDSHKVPCIDLVLLNERIKEIKENLVPKFEAHDPDGTGYVVPDVAVKILSNEFPGLPEENLRSMVKRFDEDKNNQVDFCEFIEFYAFIKSKKGDLESRFDRLDTDNSGDLDSEELIQMLVNECSLKEVQARSLVDDFDLDKNGTIDKQEFLTLWLKIFG